MDHLMAKQLCLPFMDDTDEEINEREKAFQDFINAQEVFIREVLSDPQQTEELEKVLKKLQTRNNPLEYLTFGDLFLSERETAEEGFYRDFLNLSNDRQQVDISLLSAALRVT